MEMEQRSFFEPSAPGAERFDSLDAARAAASICTRCDLADTRRQVVFGEGAPRARLMVIGEGPSAADDASGHPFSGPSGPMLDAWLATLGLRREEIWLTNVVRCWPASMARGRPRNRPPTVGEMNACRPWLETEIGLVRPAVILGLGGTAGKALVGKGFTLARGRGQWFDGPCGVPTLISFLTAYLLRLEEPELSRARALVDADLAAVRARLASA